MTLLSNREWAIIIWSLLFLIFLFLSPRMKEIRGSFKAVLSTFFSFQIQKIILLTALYSLLSIKLLYTIKLWDFSQVKNTVIWFFSVGILFLFKIEEIRKDRKYLFKVVYDNFKIIAVLEFIISTYTFPLLIELLIIPIVTFVAILTAYSEASHKNSVVTSFLNKTMAFIGFTIFGYSLYQLIKNFNEFNKVQSVYDFVTPPLLTALFIPYMYLIVIYFCYEKVFVHLRYDIKNHKFLLPAKIYSVFRFNIRLDLLERWASSLRQEEIISFKNIKDSAKKIFSLRTVEKNPPLVPAHLGWSPYQAIKFLINQGIRTGYYQKSYSDWFACSNMIQTDDISSGNNIAYYIEGTETLAKKLKLITNIINPDLAETAINKFILSVKDLYNSATHSNISTEHINAINKQLPFDVKNHNYNVKFNKISWPNHANNGYELIFELSV